MRIVIRQISGLGNQLFQYAAGRYYASRYGASLEVAKDPDVKATSHGYPRPFLLSHFSVTTPVRELTFYDRVMLSARPASNVARKVLGVDLFKESISQRYHFLPDLPIKPGAKTLYLFGYWQTYPMVQAVAHELRSELRFKEPPQGRNLEMLALIQRTADPVSLHVRRGDYTLAAEGNIALPFDYYLRAISHLKDRLVDPTFFIFSDDIPFVREHLPAGTRAVFVDHNDSFSAHEDLRLMSSCKHHILANSSFSWWGAWLNPSTEKIIVAPKHWLLQKNSFFSELTPAHWTLLATSRDL